MVEPTNSFEWAKKLECPPNACTDPVKKILSKGILELLWTEIGNASLINKEASEVRKNILLYKLKNKSKDTNIECIEKIAHIKAERKRFKTLLLKKEYEEQDFLVRQKVEQLKNIKSKYSLIKLKKELLKIKHNEVCNQLRDCKEMELICQDLMPKTSEDLTQDDLRESLNAISTLSSGATKREVKNKILNLLSHAQVSTLWTHLYQGLCQDVENLSKLKTATTLENTCASNLGEEHPDVNGEDIDMGIARLCGKRVCSFAKKVFSERKADEYKDLVIKYIENIETCINGQTDLSEWLSLVLEIKKLEVQEEVLKNEIKAIEDECDNVSALQLQQLSSEIQHIDPEIKKCVENIQQSLMLLKSAESIIVRMKDKLQTEWANLLAMRTENCNLEWLNQDLLTELNILYETLDIRALKKILLQGEIRALRYETSTMNEASVAIPHSKASNIMPYFPMIQAPIYCLVDCYKNLIANYTYRNIETSLTTENCDLPSFVNYDNDYNTMELLTLSGRNCNNTQEEIDKFNFAVNAWTNQTVQEAMTLVDKTVDGLSFTEWVKRYTTLLYMIERTHNK